MKKRIKSAIITSVLALATAFSLTACGDNTEADYKVAIVKYVDDASLNQIEDAVVAQIKAKSKELGITIDVELYNGQADGTILNQIAAEVVADDVDVVVPIATPAAVLMQSATEGTDIKVVFSAVSDPVGAGLVAGNDAPGSNVTGVSDAIDTAKVIDLILLQNPDIKSIGLLYDKGQASSTASIADAKAYCETKGITVVEKTGTNTSEIQAAADALIAGGVEAIYTPQDNTVMVAELSIFEKFTAAKIPHYTAADSFALNGAFLGYGVNYVNLGALTGDMVLDVLLNGADPATTAVKTLDAGIIMVNTETAEALSIDYNIFKDHCSELKTTTTKTKFE